METGTRKEVNHVQTHRTRNLVLNALYLFSTSLGLTLGSTYIQDAYLQSGPITRELYIRPPLEGMQRRGFLWKLVKLPYGICKAGRQWANTIERWLVSDAGFDRVYAIRQLYISRGANGYIRLFLAKLTDDLLLSGLKDEIDFSQQRSHPDSKYARL